MPPITLVNSDIDSGRKIMTVHNFVVTLATIGLVGSMSAFSIERAHAAIEGKTASTSTMVYGTGYACKLTICGPNSDPADVVGCDTDLGGQFCIIKDFNPGKKCGQDVGQDAACGQNPNAGASKWCARLRKYNGTCTSKGTIITDTWWPYLNFCSGGNTTAPN